MRYDLSMQTKVTLAVLVILVVAFLSGMTDCGDISTGTGENGQNVTIRQLPGEVVAGAKGTVGDVSRDLGQLRDGIIDGTVNGLFGK